MEKKKCHGLFLSLSFSSSPYSFHYSPRNTDDNFLLVKQIHAGIKQVPLFNSEQCQTIEEKIDEVVRLGDEGKYKPCTVDRAPLRNKYDITIYKLFNYLFF